MRRGQNTKTWAELFPDGRRIFYEGNEPIEDVLARMRDDLGFEPTVSICCPAEHLDAIYGTADYGHWGS
jgi:hypothetical protein